MKAPKKLYLSQIIYGTFQYQVPDPDDDTQIEYIHKDAFIEKACEWLEPVLKNYAGYYVGKDILRDFKKYIEE